MSTNLFGQFKVYPRGFLGAKLEPVLINKSSERTVGRFQYDVSVFDANQPELVTANMAIEEAYVALVRNDINASNFEFRENVLRVLFKAFGTLDFEGWYLTQFQGPAFGEQQLDFIEDCLNFTWNGTRKMSLQNWDVLLESSQTKVKDLLLTEMAKAKFSKNFVKELAFSGRVMLPDLFCDWTTKPNGFVDLLTTCHILFGIKR
jgi:hypothetical protein